MTKADQALRGPIKDRARLPSPQASKVKHYRLHADALTHPVPLNQNPPPYGEQRY